MTLRVFIGIAAAVALWVYRWLKFHENPDSFRNLLDVLGGMLGLLLIWGLVLGVVGGVVYGIWWYIKYWDTVTLDVPDRVGLVFAICFLSILPIWWWLSQVKEKWWLKKRWAYYKAKREEKRKSKKQLTKEEKSKRSKKRILWCLKYIGIIIWGAALIVWLVILIIYLVSKS